MIPADAQAVSRAVRPAELAEAAKAGTVDLAAVAEAAACRACELWARATRTVFGQGPVPAALMLVGEQPGDREDVEGAPFVGPAGRVLDEAMAAAGLDRERTFVTNERQLRRDPRQAGPHLGPVRSLVQSPFLSRHRTPFEVLDHDVLILLGATAAQALIGPGLRITEDRGRPLESSLAPVVIATIHPSAVLRAGGGSNRTEAMAGLVRDLEVAARSLPAARGGELADLPGSTTLRPAPEWRNRQTQRT